MVLASVASPQSKRNYARAFFDLGKFLALKGEPLSRASLVAYRAQLLERGLSHPPRCSTVRRSQIFSMMLTNSSLSFWRRRNSSTSRCALRSAAGE
jgi:hypothetical protein